MVGVITRAMAVMCEAEICDEWQRSYSIRKKPYDLDVAPTLALAGRNARILHAMSRAEKIGELGHCPIMCSL